MVGRVRTWVIAACLGSALAAGAVRAQQPLVTTVVDDCVPINRAQLDRLLSIELGTSADTALSSATGPTHVHVRCVPAGIELNLQDALTQKGMVRVLSRESFQDASSTRLLALAIAEFVVASWVELRLPQKVEPVPVIGPAPATEQARRAAATKAGERVQSVQAGERSHTELGVSGQLHLWSEQQGALLGAGLRLLHTPVSSVAFSLAGDFGAGAIDSALGRVLVRTFAFSLAGLGRIELPPFVLMTGPGARLGLAQISATPYDRETTEPSPFYAPFGGVFWLLRSALFVTEGFALALDVELGACTLPVLGIVGDEAIAAIDGVWLNAGLGLSLEL